MGDDGDGDGGGVIHTTITATKTSGEQGEGECMEKDAILRGEGTEVGGLCRRGKVDTTRGDTRTTAQMVTYHRTAAIAIGRVLGHNTKETSDPPSYIQIA